MPFSIGGALEAIGGGRSEELGFDQEAVEEALSLALAGADPKSPRFKRLARLLDARYRRDLIRGTELTRDVYSRARARGDVLGGVNPERRDEAIHRMLTSGFMEARERARMQARDTLLMASRAAAGAASPALAAQGQDLRSQGIGNIADLVGFGASFFK